MRQARESVFLGSVVLGVQIRRTLYVSFAFVILVEVPFFLVVGSSATNKLLLSQGSDLYNSFNSQWILYSPSCKSIKLSNLIQTSDFFKL